MLMKNRSCFLVTKMLIRVQQSRLSNLHSLTVYSALGFKTRLPKHYFIYLWRRYHHRETDTEVKWPTPSQCRAGHKNQPNPTSLPASRLLLLEAWPPPKHTPLAEQLWTILLLVGAGVALFPSGLCLVELKAALDVRPDAFLENQTGHEALWSRAAHHCFMGQSSPETHLHHNK